MFTEEIGKNMKNLGPKIHTFEKAAEMAPLR
jgi:hypothetical protein